MGQCISDSHRKLLPREDSKRFFYKSKPGNLSATFHILDSNLRWDLLNVNTANEEQLMTLPGINRVTALNIVEYRQKIGGFKKVEDLALVSGIGATKLEQFRMEITVGRRKCNGSSYNSSLTESMDSLQTMEASTRSSPIKLINLNSANVFQLMSVCHMTQEMAANIVHYREKKGPFKSVDHLLKVKGLPPDRLSIVRMYLTVDSNQNSTANGKVNQNNLHVHQPSYHRRTNSAPSGFVKSRSSDLSSKDLYNLLPFQMPRPIVKEEFKFLRSGRRAMRLSFWNLENFVLDKAKNPGVREVICRTILENGLSLIAVQEVACKDALTLVTTELNDPQLKNVRNWDGCRGQWQSVLSSVSENTLKKTLMNGFLFDSSRVQLRKSSFLSMSPERQKALTLTCPPALGWFSAGNIDFVVVTFSLLSEISIANLLPNIIELLQQELQGEKNIFLVGNFILPPSHEVFDNFINQGFVHLIPSSICANLESQQDDSHVWASLNIKKLHTGHSGVITEGLNHMVIPKGWEWNGRVSDHSPVWTEIFTEENSANSSNNALLMNGTCKALETKPSQNGKTLMEFPKGEFWNKDYVWKYNNRSEITCERNIVQQNGAV